MNEQSGHASALYSLALAGEVDDTNQLIDIEAAYRDGEAVDIVIDLDEVTYLGSAGLETVAVLCTDAAVRGGTVPVACAPGPVVKAIQTSRLDRLLVLADLPRAG